MANGHGPTMFSINLDASKARDEGQYTARSNGQPEGEYESMLPLRPDRPVQTQRAYAPKGQTIFQKVIRGPAQGNFAKHRSSMRPPQ